MGLHTARTTHLIDTLAELRPRLRAQLAADGELCATDQELLDIIQHAKHEAMRIDEGQLDAVSLIRTGSLNPHRHRRRERLEAQIQAECLEALEIVEHDALPPGQ